MESAINEPVRYTGTEQPDKHHYDGGLRHAIGVHRYQAMRAVRMPHSDGQEQGWTYNHQPYLAYWNERFYLQYLSNPVSEHIAPGRTLLATSEDGREWSEPVVIFPVYELPEHGEEDDHVPAGFGAVMHQRMGFYTAPSGMLLTLGFYGICPTPMHSPNTGKGIGRVVRAVREDGLLGPIYFIRYNRHAGWNESNTSYPFYKTSQDAAFVEACEALLADKLMTMQWWEEDRAKDGFYTFEAPPEGLRAPSYYHRPDGTVVALWKQQYAALSSDEGRTWTPIVKCPTLMECFAKTWGQRTADGKYALVYGHSATRRNRFPMVVMTGSDGRDFDNMLCLESEVSPMRFTGQHKNLGSQYVRGIEEGNGTPPGSYLWNTWSMNKEDIWVCRTRLPVTGAVDEHVSDDFATPDTGSDLGMWSIYSPQWAPVRVVEFDGRKCLELRDEDPYDYALAERGFPASRKITVSLRVNMTDAGHGVPEIEVQDRHGVQPIRLRLEREWLIETESPTTKPVRFLPGEWCDLTIRLDCENQTYGLAINGVWIRNHAGFGREVESLERLVVRTGSWRQDVRLTFLDGEPRNPGYCQEDRPGADAKVPLTRLLIDYVKTVAD